MIKAIIFDWFGVCAEKWIDVWKRELADQVDMELLKDAYLKYLDDSVKGKRSVQQFLELVLREIKLNPKDYKYLIKMHGKLNTELLSIILKLRYNYKTALLSDNFDEMVKIIEKKIGGFHKYFDVVVLSNVLKMIKKDMYRITLQRLKEKPGNCAFVDDRKRNIETAQKIGFNTILFENNTQLKKEFDNMDIVYKAKEK